MVPQVIWVCILCRKKQELVVKTGKWILPSVPGSMQQQQQQQSIGGFSVSGLLINDKRPRLERAVSYDRESIGVHHHRASSTSSVSGGYADPSELLRSGSSLGGQGQPNPNAAAVAAPTYQTQRVPLQRSGSLQSHGTSSWRPVPHQMSSDLDNSTARGTFQSIHPSSSSFFRL